MDHTETNSNVTRLIDRMSIVQKINGNFCCNEIVPFVLNMALKDTPDSFRVDIVFGTYHRILSKGFERAQVNYRRDIS